MLKVAHVAKNLPPFIGGMETAALLMAEIMAASGFDVILIGARSAAAAAHQALPAGLSMEPLPVAFRIGPVAVTPGVRAIIRRLAAVDMSFLHIPNPLTCLAFLAYERLFPARRRRQVHVAVLQSPIGRWRWLARIWERTALRAVLHRVDHVIVSTPHTRDYFATFVRLPHDKVTVLPIAVPAPPAMDTAAQAAEILAVGRLVPYKGFDTLIRAAARLRPGVTVNIVGAGPQRSALEALISALGLTDRVKLLGQVSTEEKYRLLARCRLLAAPSRTVTEAFGLAIAEAFSAGKPVVTTTIPTGVQFLARGGACGAVVPPDDPTALAVALQRLLDDPALAAERGAANLRFWEETLTIAAFRARYLELVDRLSPARKPDAPAA